MARTVKDWQPDKVADSEVAPHRYTWSADLPDFRTWKECRDGAAYKPGEVVYIDRDGAAVLARVLCIIPYRDRFGDLKESYHVQLATAKGLWSRQWIQSWPGFIQRGYRRAGLAPDVLD